MKSDIEEGLELKIQYEKFPEGLIPTIVQDFETLEILMLAYTNEDSFRKTIDLGFATFWSRSQNKLWTKGLTSGDLLKIKEIRIDCDQDTLLYLVEKQGKGVCHTNNQYGEKRETCFYRKFVSSNKLKFIEEYK